MSPRSCQNLSSFFSLFTFHLWVIHEEVVWTCCRVPGEGNGICLPWSQLFPWQADCLGEGRGAETKKRGGQAPRPVLVSLGPKFLMKASVRIDCADQDLVDLAVRNIGGGLFQKLQKLTCSKSMLYSVWTFEMFEYKCFLCLIEVWKGAVFTGDETLHLLCDCRTGR